MVDANFDRRHVGLAVKVDWAAKSTLNAIDDIAQILANWERDLLAAKDAEIALLRGALKTVHLAGTFGGTNQEVANRIAELEYTHLQAKQYMANAQEREHTINERDAEIKRLREALTKITSASRSWHDYHHGSDIVPCDEICAALPECEAALAAPPTGTEEK